MVVMVVVVVVMMVVGGGGGGGGDDDDDNDDNIWMGDDVLPCRTPRKDSYGPLCKDPCERVVVTGSLRTAHTGFIPSVPR
jgi:hypothetical protein